MAIRAKYIKGPFHADFNGGSDNPMTCRCFTKNGWSNYSYCRGCSFGGAGCRCDHTPPACEQRAEQRAKERYERAEQAVLRARRSVVFAEKEAADAYRDWYQFFTPTKEP